MLSAFAISILASWFGSSTTDGDVPPPPTPPTEACDEKEPRLTSDGLRVFTPEELSRYKGDQNEPKIYIAAMGHVFDVTEGKKFYAPRMSYAHFAGRDSSRSFVTGDSHPEKLTDDLTGLDDEELEGVAGWYRFYDEHEVYKKVGMVEGRWYRHETGKPDEPFPWLRLEQKKELQKSLKERFPDCNSRWSQKEGTEVWCTTLSGGVQREWVGVPRKFFPEGADRERCACINEGDMNEPGLTPYADCAPDARRCKVPAVDAK